MFAAEGALDHRGILLLCLCLWGAAACLQTTDSGLRGEEIIRLHREGGAALAGETVDQDMLDQFRPAYEKNGFCRGRQGADGLHRHL